MTYDVVLLIEQELSDTDSAQVFGLHSELDDRVRYHLLLPIEDAAARIEAGLAAVSVGDGMVMPPPEIPESVQRQLVDDGQSALNASIARLHAVGADANGSLVMGEPIDSLAKRVTDVDAREVIVMTRPHVVAEFFHADWTSRARRHIKVPLLHLVEHSV